MGGRGQTIIGLNKREWLFGLFQFLLSYTNYYIFPQINYDRNESRTIKLTTEKRMNNIWTIRNYVNEFSIDYSVVRYIFSVLVLCASFRYWFFRRLLCTERHRKWLYFLAIWLEFLVAVMIHSLDRIDRMEKSSYARVSIND